MGGLPADQQRGSAGGRSGHLLRALAAALPPAGRLLLHLRHQHRSVYSFGVGRYTPSGLVGILLQHRSVYTFRDGRYTPFRVVQNTPSRVVVVYSFRVGRYTPSALVGIFLRYW